MDWADIESGARKRVLADINNLSLYAECLFSFINHVLIGHPVDTPWYGPSLRWARPERQLENLRTPRRSRLGIRRSRRKLLCQIESSHERAVLTRICDPKATYTWPEF